MEIDPIIHYLFQHGPSKGRELYEQFFEDRYSLWLLCMATPILKSKSIATHYLRLDKHLQDYGRLSPSIWREFFSYTVVGLSSQEDLIEKKALELKREIKSISEKKYELAHTVCNSVYEQLSFSYTILRTSLTFLLAGDVVYDMAHEDPRPETYTGELVVGSDIDIVIIVSDAVDLRLKKLIEDVMYEHKFRLLTNPFHKEELDYVVKSESYLKSQMRLETFKDMVAMKVFCEAKFLCGSQDYFVKLNSTPELNGIRSVFKEMEKKAISTRKQAESILLGGTRPESSPLLQVLFYPAEESEEF